jgi:hypothetical protein
VSRPELVALLADVDATIGRVRALSQHPSRSAALHSLTAARRHLERVGKQPATSATSAPRDKTDEYDSRPTADWYPPEPAPVVERIHHTTGRLSPARKRTRESFGETQRILREATYRGKR